MIDKVMKEQGKVMIDKVMKEQGKVMIDKVNFLCFELTKNFVGTIK